MGNYSGSVVNFNQTGGTLKSTRSGCWAKIGDAASSTAVYDMTGGTFDMRQPDNGCLVVGGNGNGTLNVSNGAFLAASALLIGESANGVGVVNLGEGGTISIRLQNYGSSLGAGSGSGTFNFDGGTLQIGGAGAFLKDNLVTTVSSKGGTIDTQGYTYAVNREITGPGALTIMGAGGSVVLSCSQAFTGDLTISNGTAIVIADSKTFAGRIVLGGASSKIRVDTANSHEKVITISATGYSVPSGGILDYVELTDSSSYTKSLSGNTITVTRNDPVATWTGTANDGSPSNAANWRVTQGETVLDNTLPDGDTVVVMQGQNVNMLLPSGSTLACKAFEIGNCTFTTNCDWSGLSVTPTITGTANLNGYNLHLSHLAASAGSSFSNSAAGTTSEVRFTAADTTYSSFGESQFIDDAANLSLASNVRIVLVKEGNGAFTSTNFQLQNQSFEVDFLQSEGTVNLGSGTELKIGTTGSGRGVYQMSGGSLTATTDFIVGSGAVGEFIQTGGDVTLQNWFSLGRYNGGNGTYTITGGSLLVNKASNSKADKVYVGAASNSRGTINVGGNGNVELRCALTIGAQLSGNGGKGYVNVSGNGYLLTTGDNFIGQTAGETGEFRQTGGIAQCNGVTRLCYEDSSSGLLDISGTGEYRAVGNMTVGARGILSVHDGGRLLAKSISTGKASAGAFFDGGTIVATNVTDGATLISGFSNVTCGPSGLTVDTAGHNVNMANNTFSGTSGGSALVKQGAGTLTVDTLPPVNTVVVESGTLALGTSADNTVASTLAHRWSFTDGSLEDSVGGVTATAVGSALSYADGKVTMSGNGHNTGSLNLGSNLIQGGNATIEIWAQKGTVKSWSRIFEYGYDTSNVLLVPWTYSTTASRSQTTLWIDGIENTVRSDNFYNQNGMLHIVVRIAARSDGKTVVTTICRNSTSATPKVITLTTPGVWSLAKIAGGQFSLGRTHCWTDADANATYDEVRVWNCALSDDAIALSYTKGADASAADIAEIAAANTAAADHYIGLSAGGTLDLGGNSLVQPYIYGDGTVQNGSLEVTTVISPAGNGIGTLTLNNVNVTTRAYAQLHMNIGATTHDLLVVNGTLDLTDVDLFLLDPENQTLEQNLAGKSSVTLVQCSTPITGMPFVWYYNNGYLDLPAGWRLEKTKGGKELRLHKNGMTIHIR